VCNFCSGRHSAEATVVGRVLTQVCSKEVAYVCSFTGTSTLTVALCSNEHVLPASLALAIKKGAYVG
jgi:hypothetical protein